MSLPFDGSFLGYWDWNMVIGDNWYPTSEQTCGSKPPTLHVWTIMSFPNKESKEVEVKPIHLLIKVAGTLDPARRRIRRQLLATGQQLSPEDAWNGALDQVIIDELKPLFGLIKMGTHRVIIDRRLTHPNGGCDWLAKPEAIENKIELGESSRRIGHLIPTQESYLVFNTRNYDIVDEPVLSHYNGDKTVKNNDLTPEMQEDLKWIVRFRMIIRASDTNSQNILVIIGDDGKKHLLSIDEMHFKRSHENWSTKGKLLGQYIPANRALYRDEFTLKLMDLNPRRDDELDWKYSQRLGQDLFINIVNVFKRICGPYLSHYVEVINNIKSELNRIFCS